MITYLSDAHKFSVVVQGDTSGTPAQLNLYDRSRSMLTIERQDAQRVTVFAIKVEALPGTWVNYYSDPKGKLEIPLRNFVLANESAGYLRLSINMYEVGSSTLVDFSSYVKFFIYSGISYYDMVAPRHNGSSYMQAYIFPPNVIYNPTMLGPLTAPGIIVESNFGTWGPSISMGLTWQEVVGGLVSTVTPTGARSNQLEVANTADMLQVTDGSVTNVYKLLDTEPCAELVLCQWTSLTGAVRRHVFPIASYLQGVDKAVSLVSPGDGYQVAKNATKGVRCRITGLTPYSVWYYSDILQANDLHAIIVGTQAGFSVDIASKDTLAYAEGDTVDTPEGNAFYSFEFTIKLRHYDTV